MSTQSILLNLCCFPVGLVLSASLLTGDGPAHEPHPPYVDARLVTHKINDHLYMLEAGRLDADVLVGNVLVSVGDDGVLLVDDQYMELTDNAWREDMRTAVAK